MLPGLTLLLIALAGCFLFYLQPAWFPVPITAGAIAWDHHFSLTIVVTGALFLAAQMVLAWMIIRGTRRKGSDARAPGSTTGPSRHIGIFNWSVAGAMVLIEVVLAGSGGAMKIPGAAEIRGSEVIEAGARQFAWHFRYPGPDGKFGRTNVESINDATNPFGIDENDPNGKDDFVTTTLHIPVGRDITLKLHSKDVIHDFFVRELRTKQDVVPGMENVLYLHVDRPGDYEIACAELCGIGHYQMRSSLIVRSPAEFEQWKRDQQ